MMDRFFRSANWAGAAGVIVLGGCLLLPSDPAERPTLFFVLMWIVFPLAYLMYAIYVGAWVLHWLVAKAARGRL